MEKGYFDMLMEGLEDIIAFQNGDTHRARVVEVDFPELEKELLRAWDPDYTKLTPQEARELAEAEASGFVREEDIDWNDLSKYRD